MGLRVALLATFAAINVKGYEVAPDVVLKTTQKTDITNDYTSSLPPSHYSIMAKDGEGEAYIKGTNLTTYYAFNVREGTLRIGDGQSATTLYHNVKYQSPGGFTLGLTAAGKDAVLLFDKATYSCTTSPEQIVVIGGADGNGSMVIDHESYVDFSNGNLTVIGEAKSINYSYNTTKEVGQEPAEENLYRGNYTAAANGSGKEFGRGSVTLQGGSTWRTGYAGLYMGEGELNVRDSATAYLCEYDKYSFVQMGFAEDSTSVLNVSDGGKVYGDATYYLHRMRHQQYLPTQYIR